MTKTTFIVVLFLLPIVVFSQDLESGGANSWLFHTPDDGRTTLYIVPKINGNWDWAYQTEFRNNGDVVIPGRLGISSITANDGLVVQSNSNYHWNIGSGEGDFKIGNVNYGLHAGIALGGSGAGTAYLWTKGGEQTLRIGNPTAGTIMQFSQNGNIGVGTSNPAAPLDIKKPLRDGDLMILGLDSVHPKRISMGTSAWSGVIGLFDPGSLQKVRISAGNGYTYFNGTNVLIGKTSQSNTSYKLDVAGKVRANEIVVNTTGADYVFEEDYDLKSLAEVEGFIQENGHLPGVPSAAEMQKEGMAVSELNTKLLEKVEELTLYVIELKKENNQHLGLIKDLQSEISRLKDR